MTTPPDLYQKLGGARWEQHKDVGKSWKQHLYNNLHPIYKKKKKKKKKKKNFK